jgi:hypothetical protein
MGRIDYLCLGMVGMEFPKNHHLADICLNG